MGQIVVGRAFRWGLSIAAAALSLAGHPEAARADCLQSGTTVTCLGTTPGGFTAGGGQNALTVNVGSGATVGTSAGSTGLTVNSANTISNNGAISVGDNAMAAINGTDANTIVNSGGITAGSLSNGILLNNGATITQNGTITVGNTSNAILVTTGNGTVVNSGTIQAGTNSGGIQASDITNNGTITVRAQGIAIQTIVAGARVVNNNTITVGDSGTGINSIGGSTSILNAGTIAMGGCTTGIQALGTNNTVVNSGTIRNTGCGGSGITSYIGGSVLNAGTIAVGNGGFGVFAASSNTITNSGNIVVGIDGTGIFAGRDSIVRNTGTIIAGNSLTPPSGGIVAHGTNVQLFNSGTIIGGTNVGAMITTGASSLLNNSGTITVGNSGGGMVGFLGNNTFVNSGTITTGNTGLGIDAQGNGSTIINSGRIDTGSATSFGIQARNSSIVTNSGTINVGDNSFGIATNVATTVNNSGSVTAGTDSVGIGSASGRMRSLRSPSTPTSTLSAALLSIGNNLQATNTATGILTAGGSTPGMLAMGNGSSLTNLGTIAVGAGGSGMSSAGSNTAFNNGGTIGVGASGIGIAVRGANSTATSSGTINTGTSGIGIAVQSTGSTAANSGTINTGTGGVGIAVQVAGSTATNSGTINAGSGGFGLQTTGASTLVNSGTINTCGTGMDGSGGAGSRLGNSGTISAGSCGSVGVILGQGSSFTNSGFVSAPTVIALGAGSGSASVTNNGTLNGTIALTGSGGNNFTNSGTIAAGGSVTPGGGLAHVVDGTFTQTASGVFVTRMTTNSAPTNYDTLRVSSTVPGTGIANLGGTIQVSLQPGLYPLATTYSGVLTFSGSTGSFAGVTEPYTFLNANAVYNPTSVDIVVTRVPFNQPTGGGGNAQALGNILEANYSPFLTGQLATFYMALLQSTAPNTLQQLTGEVATAPQTAAFGVFGQYLSTIFGQTSSARAFGGAPQSAAAQRVAVPSAETCSGEACDTAASAPIRYTAWSQGFGGSGSIDGNTTTGASRIDMTAGGGATGMDMRLANNALVGVALGMGSSGYNLTDLMSSGTSRSIIAGLYGGYAAGPAYIDGALAYAYNTFTSSRFIGTGSISEIESAAFSGSQYGGRLESGWRFAFDRNLVTPFAGLTVQALSQSAYTESSRNSATGGPGILGVSVQTQTTLSVRSTLGAQFETALTFNDDNVLRPRLRLGWAHEFDTNRTATATLSSLLPYAPFQVTGAQPAADSLIVGAGFDLDLGRQVRLYGQFDGDLTNNARAFSATGGFRLVW